MKSKKYLQKMSEDSQREHEGKIMKAAKWVGIALAAVILVLGFIVNPLFFITYLALFLGAGIFLVLFTFQGSNPYYFMKIGKVYIDNPPEFLRFLGEKVTPVDDASELFAVSGRVVLNGVKVGGAKAIAHIGDGSTIICKFLCVIAGEPVECEMMIHESEKLPWERPEFVGHDGTKEFCVEGNFEKGIVKIERMLEYIPFGY